MNLRVATTLTLALAFGAPALAQSEPATSGLEKSAASAQADFESATRELVELRAKIAAEKLPLNQELAALEARLSSVRRDFDDLGRSLDTRNLDFNNLETEIKTRKDEKVYLANLLGEYVRNFESRVHISELQRYDKVLETARMAPENKELAPAQVFDAQLALVERSIDRVGELIGGATFDGGAVAPDGTVKDGRFVLLGPVALFSAADGSVAGLAEQKLGSLAPNIVTLPEKAFGDQIRAIASRGAGTLPFDPSLGNALKIEETRDSFVEHIRKGGPVMIPILALAVAALLVALWKWFQIARVQKPPAKQIAAFLESVKKRDLDGARRQAENIPGPTGEMLRDGMAHVHESKDLVEEVMFEKVLDTRLSLNSLLSFIAMSASASPLLGLLGTVTGMINTFRLITVFGSGDARRLSSGISEALITTEYGLIVAIPALLLYAYLSRRVAQTVDGMEKSAVAFLNRLSAGAPRPEVPPRVSPVSANPPEQLSPERA